MATRFIDQATEDKIEAAEQLHYELGEIRDDFEDALRRLIGQEDSAAPLGLAPSIRQVYKQIDGTLGDLELLVSEAEDCARDLIQAKLA